MGIKLGKLSIDDPVILAVSEMIASQAMIRATRQSLKLATNCAEEFPMAVQLAGCEPQVMAEAARLCVDRGAAIIDINFGCPVKKIVTKQAGSALMRDEALAGRILEAVVAAVPVPVTLKMRLGWDAANLNAPRMARIAEAAGIRLLTVHGRTRCQLYGGVADWAALRRVREATTLPLIVNGDIDSLAAVREALRQSGADGVMIGRGACGRPWFLRQVIDVLAGRGETAAPDPATRCALVLEHYEDMLSHYGEAQGLRIARKHLGWYAKGLTGAAEFRATVNRAEDPRVVRGEIRDLFARSAETIAA
jgi:tRNA-dihydrouridine synthase B